MRHKTYKKIQKKTCVCKVLNNVLVIVVFTYRYKWAIALLTKYANKCRYSMEPKLAKYFFAVMQFIIHAESYTGAIASSMR